MLNEEHSEVLNEEHLPEPTTAGVTDPTPTERGDDPPRAPILRAFAPSREITDLNFVSGMVSEENSEQVGSLAVAATSQQSAGLSARHVDREIGLGAVEPHETPDTNPSSSIRANSCNSCLISESSSLRFAAKQTLWHRYQSLLAQGLSQNQCAQRLGVSGATLSRMRAAVAQAERDGLTNPLEALADNYHRSGRKTKLTLTEPEEQRLQQIYLQTNRTAVDGSMRTACKFFALEPQTREELRTVILAQLDKGLLPTFALKALRKITSAHFLAKRKPGMLSTHFSGRVGAFAKDKRERRRIVESDDATLNFPAWIEWPHGGDPCSDKFRVKIGRWQFLPAMEAGWSQYYLGYSLIARTRGTYRAEDVQKLIHLVVTRHGLPDEFRFERGTWESNRVVELLARLGVELTNVYQSNHKPYIEGGFNTLWTYLSVIDGQVGRYRGEEEKGDRLLARCQAGLADPRDYFPSLAQCTKALDGALAMRNQDKIRSRTYGEWIPEVRYREHAEERPWQKLDPSLDYLFAPIVREWTVRRGGHVGGNVLLADGLSVPFYFHNDDLWRSDGHLVRVYFNPESTPCTATIVAIEKHLHHSPGDVICQANLLGEIPHFTRAALGWADPASIVAASIHGARPTATLPSQRGPLSAVRRETRALAPTGRILSTESEERDGRGNTQRLSKTSSPDLRASAPSREPLRASAPPREIETEDLTPIASRPSPILISETILTRRREDANDETETL